MCFRKFSESGKLAGRGLRRLAHYIKCRDEKYLGYRDPQALHALLEAVGIRSHKDSMLFTCLVDKLHAAIQNKNHYHGLCTGTGRHQLKHQVQGTLCHRPSSAVC